MMASPPVPNQIPIRNGCSVRLRSNANEVMKEDIPLFLYHMEVMRIRLGENQLTDWHMLELEESLTLERPQIQNIREELLVLAERRIWYWRN